MYKVSYNKETEEFDIFREDGSKLNSIKDPEMFVAMLPFIYNTARVDTIENVKDSVNMTCDMFKSILKEKHPEMNENLMSLFENVTRDTVNNVCDRLIEKSIDRGFYNGN